MRAIAASIALAACVGPAAAEGTLHVTLHDDAPTAALAAVVRPVARAFEERLHGHPITDDDVLFDRWLDLGTIAFVAYRNRNVLDGGPSWCWVANKRAECSESGALVLARGLRVLGTARPTDAEFPTVVAMLVSDQRPLPGARVEAGRFEYAVEHYDEARSKKVRVDERVRITSAGDVLVAPATAPSGAVAGPTELSFEGDRIGSGYVTRSTLAPLRAQSAAFARCFADAADPYPIVGIDLVLDGSGRVDVLAVWGTRVSMDATACVTTLVRATRFDKAADREGRLSINRHAP